MTIGGDLPHEQRAPLHLLPHDEEHRPRARAREELEHSRRPFGMRPVIETQDDTVDLKRALYPQSASRGGDVRCEQVPNHRADDRG